MNVKYKRPFGVSDLGYQTDGAACFDLAASASTRCTSGLTIVPTGLVIGTPADHLLMIVPRSSLMMRTGLTVITGIVDEDYCGEEDKIGIQVWNPTDDVINVGEDERIAQGVFIPITRANFVEAISMSATSRGGFGSTGH